MKAIALIALLVITTITNAQYFTLGGTLQDQLNIDNVNNEYYDYDTLKDFINMSLINEEDHVYSYCRLSLNSGKAFNIGDYYYDVDYEVYLHVITELDNNNEYKLLSRTYNEKQKLHNSLYKNTVNGYVVVVGYLTDKFEMKMILVNNEFK